MYEDIESSVTFGGGTLALTGVAFNIEWLVAVAFLAVIAGVTTLRLAKR
jgi:hypothetical protein